MKTVTYKTICYSLFVIVIFSLSGSLFAQSFSFAVTSDHHQYTGEGLYDTPFYFRGAIETLASIGAGAFIISVGDICPCQSSEWTIRQVLGSSYLWYPVVGNHELPGNGVEDYDGANMGHLRTINANGNTLPYIVNIGPEGSEETTYSFDYNNCHFVVINEYYDGFSDVGTNGDVVDGLYDWLVADLTATMQQHKFVFGHEPAYPQPDVDTGRIRHEFDSLNKYTENRDRFWQLLVDEGVLAYICGHSHNYSIYNHNGVWQINNAHTKGLGETTVPSTFIKIMVNGDDVVYVTFRDEGADGTYGLRYTGSLTSPEEPEIIVPAGAVWNYLDDGSDQGTAWRELDFDDTAWKSGAAQLGYGDGDETTVISYGPDADNKNITTYFRHSFNVPEAGIYTSLILQLLRDDGAIVYLNGTEVYRTNLSDSSMNYQTFADNVVSGSDEDQFFDRVVRPSLLVNRFNVLAVELHQAYLTSSDISFDLSLSGTIDNIPITLVSGQIYIDSNRNGSRDTDEEGLSGVNVFVNDEQEKQTIISNRNGDWSAFVRPGMVTIDVDESDPDFPADVIQIEGDDPTDILAVEGMTTDAGTDGFYISLNNTIGDFVWNDGNHNGLQERGENGVEGITVTLFNKTGQVGSFVSTDAKGHYEFTSLDSGTYHMQFSHLPIGGIFTLQDVNNNNSDMIDSDADPLSGMTASFTLNRDEIKTDIDAGIYIEAPPEPTRASGFIWNDGNGNGFFNKYEKGIPFITVNLLFVDSLIIEASTTADIKGYYTFSGITPGDHIIEVVNPNPQFFDYSPKDIGSDDTIDSDVDANGRTDILSFGEGEDKKDIDAGLISKGNSPSSEEMSSYTTPPREYDLLQNTPNPFNPRTHITFQVKIQGDVLLTLFNLQGQLIKILAQGHYAAGIYTLIWDGTNDQGMDMPSGTYLYQLKVNDFLRFRKMVYMK